MIKDLIVKLIEIWGSLSEKWNLSLLYFGTSDVYRVKLNLVGIFKKQDQRVQMSKGSSEMNVISFKCLLGTQIVIFLVYKVSTTARQRLQFSIS